MPLKTVLGDGIMCFYGAPQDNAHHARDAVQTALDMLEEMGSLNQELAARGLPEVGVRIGISTGKMVVGDAGTNNCSDYTVLGNAVNLGSRLEGANKYLGTRIIVTAETAAACADQFLFRPLGKIRVVGIQQGVEVFEPLGVATKANQLQLQLIELSERMLAEYRSRMLGSCLKTLDEMDQSTGCSTKITAAYRDLCSRNIQFDAVQNQDGWDETLVLSEK